MSCCGNGGEILIVPGEGGPAGVERGELGLEGVVSSWEEFFGFSSPEDADSAMRERMHDLRSRPFVAKVPEDRIEEELARLREQPNVAAATRNWRVSLDAPVTGLSGAHIDMFELVEFLDRVGLPNRWDPQPGEASVRVAVLDSGVDPSAVQCCDVLDPLQLDAAALGTALRTNPHDPDGHGSVVAGLIHRLAPGARITSVRCFGSGPSTLADVVYGLLFARLQDEPIDVFNLSFSVDFSVDECPACGYTYNTTDERTAMHNLFEHLRTELEDRPVFVAAAGNRGGTVAIPAALDGVIAVGSTGASSRAAPLPDPSYDQIPGDFVLAPGGSEDAPVAAPTWMHSKEGVFGTSFATAVTTGVLAAILANPDLHGIPPGRGEARRGATLRALGDIARTDFPGYSTAVHGMGVVA